MRPKLEATVTIPEAPRWIEACEGFGCGQCHKRNYTEGAVLGTGEEASSSGRRHSRVRAFFRDAANLFVCVFLVATCLCCFRSAQRIHSAGVELGVLDEKKPLIPGTGVEMGIGKTA